MATGFEVPIAFKYTQQGQEKVQGGLETMLKSHMKVERNMTGLAKGLMDAGSAGDVAALSIEKLAKSLRLGLGPAIAIGVGVKIAEKLDAMAEKIKEKTKEIKLAFQEMEDQMYKVREQGKWITDDTGVERKKKDGHTKAYWAVEEQAIESKKKQKRRNEEEEENKKLGEEKLATIRKYVTLGNPIAKAEFDGVVKLWKDAWKNTDKEDMNSADFTQQAGLHAEACKQEKEDNENYQAATLRAYEKTAAEINLLRKDTNQKFIDCVEKEYEAKREYDRKYEQDEISKASRAKKLTFGGYSRAGDKGIGSAEVDAMILSSGMQAFAKGRLDSEMRSKLKGIMGNAEDRNALRSQIAANEAALQKFPNEVADIQRKMNLAKSQLGGTGDKTELLQYLAEQEKKLQALHKSEEMNGPKNAQLQKELAEQRLKLEESITTEREKQDSDMEKRASDLKSLEEEKNDLLEEADKAGERGHGGVVASSKRSQGGGGGVFGYQAANPHLHEAQKTNQKLAQINTAIEKIRNTPAVLT